MRRRISLLLAVVLAGSTLTLFGPSQPASAMLVCGGSGTAFVTPGLLFPVLLGVLGGPAKDHTIDILIGSPNIPHAVGWLFAPSTCVHTAVPPTTRPLGGFGILRGYCGHAAGTGTLSGEPFAFVHLGTLLIFTGHFVGAGNVLLTSTTGSCLHVEAPLPTNPFALPAGATTVDFQLVGLGLNCTNALPPSETLMPLTLTSLLPTPTVGLHVTTGVHFYTMPQCTSPSILL